MKLSAEGVSADLTATHAMLREMLEASTNTPRIAACGFCMGGRLAFIANALLPLDAAISFYGGGIAGQLAFAPQQHGPLMLFWAGKDGFISKDDRRNTADALEAAGKPFTEVNVSHADHGFFCDQRKSYDAEAANEAWGMVSAFLASHLSEK
jgi:carboxymethylenebutenolidase